MAERSKNSSSSSRTKLRFPPKPPDTNEKKARATSSIQQEAGDKYVIDKDVMTRLKTRSAASKTAAGKDDDKNEQNPQPSSLGDLQAEAKTWNKYIELPMRPDNTNSELNKQEFGQSSLTSSEMEASVNSAEVLGLEKESEQSRMVLFQFPKSLPYEIWAPNAEEADGKGKTNTKKIGCNLQQLPAGYVGKMVVYKSGKVKMKLGDVIFDVNPGVSSIIHEQAVAINTKKGHFCEIGNIEQQSVVVTPDLDALLEGTKN